VVILVITAAYSYSNPEVPTPTANAGYSSYYTSTWQSGGFIVTQPFTKSTNVRGNDIYLGIIKNATLANAAPMTVVEELTKSEAQAKQVYDIYVTAETNEGFSLRSDWVAALNASSPGYNGIWIGQNGQQQFYVLYRYNSDVQSWEVTTEAGTS
jgi:hypothetical protein